MGVTGLWKLIEPCGKPVPVETLEGKILAVDISIWLHQVVKGFQDNKGSALNNAHLLGLFHRLCKLLYYRVRPVFIFDGCVPQLKRDTIARRQQQRSKLNNEAERIQALIMQSLAKEKVVQQALGSNAELLLKSPAKRPTKKVRGENAMDELFKLPEIPDAANEEFEDPNDASTDYTDDYTSATDSSLDDSSARYTYNTNLQAIDVRSQHFRDLPADIRHEILIDIKETRKQSSWGKLHELPSKSDDFSSFQMKRLLKRRAVQESLEEAEQEMGGRTLTYAELSNFFNEEGIVTPTVIEQGTKQIVSDENTRFLLVRDLKKKIVKSEESNLDVKPIKCESIKEEDLKTETVEKEEKPSTSADVKKFETPLGTEYDADLALAMALSMEETKVYDEKDYEYACDQDLKLNRAQSKQLRDAAKGPARAYMIEYGGMNDDEVNNMMEKTLDDTQYLDSVLATEELKKVEPKDTVNDIDEHIVLRVSDDENEKEQHDTKESKTQLSDASDTDSDLEEVVQDKLEIVVDLRKKEFSANEDIFADVFDSEPIEIHDSEEESQNSIQNLNPQDSQTTSGQSTSNSLVPAPKPTEDNTKLLSILEELKKQTADIKNLKLEAAKSIEPSIANVIKISNKKLKKPVTTPPKSIVPAEIIEIVDDVEVEKETVVTTPQKSPKTPTKSKTITGYFETEYVIKRTPDKQIIKEGPADEKTPKITSPFFVKKTPKSERKSKSAEEHGETIGNDGSLESKQTKAAKMLFPNEEVVEESSSSSEATKPLQTEDLIKEAAEALKSQKTDDELQLMANKLSRERRELEAERNRQDRMGMSISQRMSSDCQELLRLFGIPYIVAPMEAEAQCAFLNAMELTNGTITDDSDIWLFGGRTVYKNFFAQNKHVLEFGAEQIEKSFNCDRKTLIQLACLVGSDYTTGIHGIGAVTALEIIASFSSGTGTPAKEEKLASIMDMPTVLSTLVKFRDWWQAHKNATLPPGNSKRQALCKKLKNIELQEGFPNSAVVEAYLAPKVDENKEAFTWGAPDVETIREFTRKTFGWTTSKTDDILLPVMKKLNDKKTQGSIRNYFQVKSAVTTHELQVSKRVKTAIAKLSGKIEALTPEQPVKKTRAKRKQPESSEKAESNSTNQDNEEATTSKQAKKQRAKREPTATVTNTKPKGPARAAGTKRKAKLNLEEPKTEDSLEAAESGSKVRKCVRIPNSKEFIPQRERDVEQMRINKEKAAAILRQSKEKATAKKN